MGLDKLNYLLQFFTPLAGNFVQCVKRPSRFGHRNIWKVRLQTVPCGKLALCYCALVKVSARPALY